MVYFARHAKSDIAPFGERIVIVRIFLILILTPLWLSQSYSFNQITNRGEFVSIVVLNTATSLIHQIDIDDEQRHGPASTCFFIAISPSLALPSRTDGAVHKAPPAAAARPLYKRKSAFLI
jgi:hypothetical protein